MFPTDLDELRSMGRQLGAELLPGAETASFDRPGWDALRQAGVLGMTVPRQWGGSGLTLVEFATLMEGLGYASERRGILFAANAHVFGAVEVVANSGSEEQKGRWLPQLASGEWVASHGVTEPAGGSNVQGLQTRLTRDGNEWRLSGRKKYITCAEAASFHIVYAYREEGGRRELCCVVVEPGARGVKQGALEPSGLGGCGFGWLEFDEVQIPETNTIGRPGAGGMMFQGAIERERACIWGFVLGAMDRQVEEAVERANSRVINGTPIGHHQSVSNRIAEMKLRLELCRLLFAKTAGLKGAGRRAPLEAAMTKLFLSESALANSLDSVRIFGASGYTRASGIEQAVREALGGVLYSGTSDIQRNIIAACAGVELP